MCGVESRSPPDSIPVGEACKNSVPFEDRLKPDRYNLELAVGLTFLGPGALLIKMTMKSFGPTSS